MRSLRLSLLRCTDVTFHCSRVHAVHRVPSPAGASSPALLDAARHFAAPGERERERGDARETNS